MCPSHPCAVTSAPGASPWSYELAAQASAGEELCLLPPAALEKQKGHFNQGLGEMKGGHQSEDSLSRLAGCLVQIMFLTVPGGKEPGPTPLPCLLSRGIEGRCKTVSPSTLWGLWCCIVCLGPTISRDMWGKKVPYGLPKKQYMERHLLHSPKTRCAQKCLLEPLLYCVLDSASCKKLQYW